MTDGFIDYQPSAMPQPVITFLDAHDDKRYSDALAVFAPEATVLDDGSIYRGIDEIGAWLERSSTEYTYTSTRIGQRTTDDSRTIVRIRLDGDFPGGSVTLRYGFEHPDGLITRLSIEV